MTHPVKLMSSTPGREKLTHVLHCLGQGNGLKGTVEEANTLWMPLAATSKVWLCRGHQWKRTHGGREMCKDLQLLQLPQETVEPIHVSQMWLATLARLLQLPNASLTP